jgi:hypothetical protein
MCAIYCDSTGKIDQDDQNKNGNQKLTQKGS